MQDKEKLIGVLMRGLQAELDSVKFYIRNLERLNYPENKQQLDLLTIDSIEHARMLAKEIMFLKKSMDSHLDTDIVRKAFVEETGMKEIYKYELSKTDDETVKDLMKRLIKEEEGHEHLVNSLK